MARWRAVVVTMGTRPVELARAVASLRAQEDVDLEVVVVGNGWAPEGLPDGVRTVHSPENLGPPAGRNLGLAGAGAEHFFFLDDDAHLPHPDTLARLERLLEDDPGLGVVQTRIRTPEGDSLPRWVPRMRDKDPERGSVAFSLLEGSVAVRGAVLAASDGWPGPFFYAHEGIELAWRAWDAGYRVEYHPELEAVHPRIHPSRHEDHLFLDGRNRVWLARRNLPLPLGVLYVGVRGGMSLARTARQPSAAAAYLRGVAAGLRRPAGPRRPMAWRTVWTMTRHGRPPVV
ncbi:glycosyltransferase family 2 protein [Phycicoccus flavus]|uniref:glycosyltransferase family 2 protein n=1 Tax=Phycicoccus flavus TaxID=2502783 RepID=UPI000FEB64E9|nr:glycosyltransferase [Phycicoccus flavus]NHA66772.1 glycosyltransferase [Phycicoccus flavus]